jgi:hypothetical protein
LPLRYRARPARKTTLILFSPLRGDEPERQRSGGFPFAREAGKQKRKLSSGRPRRSQRQGLFADANHQRVDLRLPQLAPRIFQLL